jgi:hypothetical protein
MEIEMKEAALVVVVVEVAAVMVAVVDQVDQVVVVAVMVAVVDQEVLVEEDLVIDQKKCIKQNVQIVEKNVKFLLNQLKADLFIAENVSKITGMIQEVQDHKEEMKMMMNKS